MLHYIYKTKMMIKVPIRGCDIWSTLNLVAFDRHFKQEALRVALNDLLIYNLFQLCCVKFNELVNFHAFDIFVEELLVENRIVRDPCRITLLLISVSSVILSTVRTVYNVTLTLLCSSFNKCLTKMQNSSFYSCLQPLRLHFFGGYR